MKTLLIMISLIASFHFNNGDTIIGEYWTENQEGKIVIFKCNEKYCGRIVWRKDARKDIENPDKSLRNRSVIGIQFLNNFEFDPKKNIWHSGTVYSIDNGGTYKGKIWLEENGTILKMRGYIGISLLGRTATLKRIN